MPQPLCLLEFRVHMRLADLRRERRSQSMSTHEFYFYVHCTNDMKVSLDACYVDAAP